tara:strand:- start:461 stop:1840 length:1380 start_codon:yes stop_codon:yes gene_type:complete
LRSALLWSATLVVAGHNELQSKSKSFDLSNSKSILIVGAGIAGIAAAKYLQDFGFDVTILEGSNRVGGRIYTKEFDNIAIDLGAAWIHGHDPKNPLVKLVDSYGLATFPTDWDQAFFYDPGDGIIDDEDFDRIAEKSNRIIEAIHELQETARSNESIEQLVGSLLKSLDEPDVVKRGILWWLSSEIETENATNYRNLSAQFWDKDEAFAGNDLLMEEGLSRMIRRMAENLDVRFGNIVEDISYAGSKIKVSGVWGEFAADRLLCTLPLGVLKANSVKFTPALPASKVESIERLGMGLLNKVVITFKHAFWPADAHILGILNNDVEERLEFFPVLPGSKSSVLVALAFGAFAKQLESMSKQEVITKIVSQLIEIEPSISSDDVVDIYVTAWSSDPLSRGAYTHIPPNSSMADPESLGRQIDNKLFFAGEATNPLYLGTMHGAYLSGIRAAKEIESSFEAS